MRSLRAAAGGMLLRRCCSGPPPLLLRRRCCSAPPLLLLLGVAVCLYYQTLVVDRDRKHPPSNLRGRESEEVLMAETRRLVSALERDTQTRSQRPPRRRALVLLGRRLASDPEVQLYQQVLQQMDYNTQLSRYAETSSLLGTHHGVSGWSLLLCLSGAETSCLRRVSFSRLQRHQVVNLLPAVMEAFSDAGGGLCHFLTQSQRTGSGLPMSPHACGSTNQKLHLSAVADSSPVGAPPPALVAMVNVYVLVTSVKPLTSFLHDITVVTTNQEQRGRPTKLRNFLLQQFGPNLSHDALGQMKKVIGDVLQAAVSTNQKQPPFIRCVLCFQFLTFSLLFSGSVTPLVVQVDTELTFSSLSRDTFDGQITKDRILEDTLHFLFLSSETETERGQYGGCRGTYGVCLSQEEFLLLLQFQRQMKTPSAFHLLFPSFNSSSSSSSSSGPLSVSDLQIGIVRLYELQRTRTTDKRTNQESAESSSQDGSEGRSEALNNSACVDPHLRQIYTDPPLTLTPPFSPSVKEYRAEVAFDTVTVRILPQPVSAACRVHLDEHRGPRMANYPVGLGNSRISILVTDDAQKEPVVMTIYTVHVFRESRPSLPMFGDHVMCSFVQDCGLLVQPGLSCGLQPFIRTQSPLQTCSSGHEPGRWLLPCLSCSDNRTCDWREVAWQPDGCYHPPVDRRRLQDCLTDRKLLFLGDSTNRGMMYFLLERVNSSLEDWGRVHDTLVYRDLNAGRTAVSYSYYPQFWLEGGRRPSFTQALLQLIHRSRPLGNSNQTVLVLGGVQWLNPDHLRTVRDVLDRESLGDIVVVVKSLGMGFHLPVDGIRSLSLRQIQDLNRENRDIIAAAKHHGYEAIDTFSITMGRHKEFLQGRCACHYHEVENAPSGPELSSQSDAQDRAQEAGYRASAYHVRGAVNQVYSEILLSRLCPPQR